MSEGKPLVEDENTTLDKIIKYFPYVAIPIAILMLAAYLYNFHGGFGDQSDFGAFGDFFGGILNPMLTFLTILLLLRQLRLQRSELNATAKELRATAEIHKENIKHNRAVDIFEKTNNEFLKTIAQFNDSLTNSFITLNRKENREIFRDIREPKEIYAQTKSVTVSLDRLNQKGELIQAVLFSPKAKDFTNELRTALTITTKLATQVYIFASEYLELGVNNLLYLQKFEQFNGRLQELQKHINSLKLEPDELIIDKSLNDLVQQSTLLILKATDILNLD